MRLPVGPLAAVDLAVFAGLFAAGGDNPQVVYGFLSVLGGLIGTAALYLAVGRWAIRRLEALEAQTVERHADNLAAMTAMTGIIAEMQHHLFGVQGVGGQREEMQRSQKFRHATRQDLQILFGVLHDHNGQLIRLSDKAEMDFDPIPIERRRRRAEDTEHDG